MVLLITRDDRTFHTATLELQGRLEGAWGDRLEVECAALLGYFTDITVDLSGVDGVDREGLRALRRLHRRGVTLVGADGTLPVLLEGEGIRIRRIATRTA